MRLVCERVPSGLASLQCRFVYCPVANVDEMACDGCCCGHLGTDQMRASTAALAAFEVAVAGGGTALAGRKNVGVHGQAHGAARLAPVKAGFYEDAVQSFGLGSCLDSLRSWDDHRTDMGRDLIPRCDASRSAQVLKPPVGAGADEDAVDGNLGKRRACGESHVFKSA